MTKAELIEKVAADAGFSKAAAGKAVSAVIDGIASALEQGDKVTLPGFGTFEVRQRPASKARNPRTGEVVDVPAKKAPAFKAGKTLKDKVNG